MVESPEQSIALGVVLLCCLCVLLICVLADPMAVDEFTFAVCVLRFDLFVCAISRRLCAGSIAFFSIPIFTYKVRPFGHVC